MKALFKTLLIWCMLLAVPLQGYAAATTLLCAPLKTPSGTVGMLQAPAAAHDHQAILLAAHADHLPAAAAAAAAAAGAGAGLPADDAGAGEQASPNHDAGAQCDACSACCLGAAMAASLVPRMPVETQQLTFISLDALFVPGVDLALPERPLKPC